MKKILVSFISLLTVLGLFFVQATPALAAFAIDSDLRPDNAPEGWSELDNPDGNASENFSDLSITYIIADIAVVLLQISGALAIFFIIMNGFNYIKAFGNEEEIQKAHKGLMWAIIGLVVVLLSYAIVQNVLKITLSVDEDIAATAETTETTE